MIAVDTNILVYAHRRDSRFHGPASEQVRALAEGRARWAIPWPCIHEFLAIVTHPRIYDPPSPVEAALAQAGAWLESPTLVVLSEGPDHWEILSGFLQSGAVTGARVHDARVAALCAASGVRELWSADRDFSRFPISVRNPLID
jgi:toxin-antitoxin system PIN domain toxin